MVFSDLSGFRQVVLEGDTSEISSTTVAFSSEISFKVSEISIFSKEIEGDYAFSFFSLKMPRGFAAEMGGHRTPKRGHLSPRKAFWES